MPRSLRISFPDGNREVWLTELVFEPGQTFDRGGQSWVVLSVDEPNEAGKHTTMTLGYRSEEGTAPLGSAFSVSEAP